jgi:hypothetical protein
MKTFRRNVLLQLSVFALIGAVAAAPALAQPENGGAPGEWLSRYTSARTLGLGGAFVAIADDPLGSLWNPAGLSMMNRNQLSFENAQMFEQTSINAFSIAVPGSWLPSVGLSVITMGSGDFERTNELNDVLGTFQESETAYLMTLSKAFSPRVAIGANLKVVQQSVEAFSGGGVGFDVGALYSVTPTLRLGASVLNVGGPAITLRDVEESYPMNLKGGFSLAVLGGRGLITGQIDHADVSGTRFAGGTEYWLQPGLAFRVGFDDEHGTGGFSYRFAPQYQVDYAVADHPLGMTHRFGVSYRFGGFFASSVADPPIFSPTGEHAVTKIALNARTKVDPREWSLSILDKGDIVVRRFGGPGQPPAHLLWDGKDETGLPLADGIYRYTLVVKDLEGRTMTSSTRQIEIATEGPQGRVPVIPLGDKSATEDKSW